MSAILTPEHNDSLEHTAARNLDFLLSAIRCGESLSEAEEQNVRRVINLLDAARARHLTEVKP